MSLEGTALVKGQAKLPLAKDSWASLQRRVAQRRRSRPSALAGWRGTSSTSPYLGGRHKAVALHVHRLRLAKLRHAALGADGNLAQHGEALERAAHNVVHHGDRQLQALRAPRDGDPRGVSGLVYLLTAGGAGRGGVS